MHALEGEDDRTVEARLYAEAMRPVYRYHWGEDDRTVEARLYAEAMRPVYRYHWGNNPGGRS